MGFKGMVSSKLKVTNTVNKSRLRFKDAVHEEKEFMFLPWPVETFHKMGPEPVALNGVIIPL